MQSHNSEGFMSKFLKNQNVLPLEITLRNSNENAEVSNSSLPLLILCSLNALKVISKLIDNE